MEKKKRDPPPPKSPEIPNQNEIHLILQPLNIG